MQVTFRLPSVKVLALLTKGFQVHQLLVGVSSKESLPVPAATEKLAGVQLLPSPLESAP